MSALNPGWKVIFEDSAYPDGRLRISANGFETVRIEVGKAVHTMSFDRLSEMATAILNAGA